MADKQIQMISGKDTPQRKSVKRTYNQLILTGIIAFVVLFGIAGGWAATVNIAGAVIATGSVAVEGKPKRIQHLDGGIVGRILVRDGDLVSEGDTLIELDDTLLKSNLTLIENRLHESLASKARLEAERDNSKNIEWPKFATLAMTSQSVEKIVDSQQKLFEARRDSVNGQIEQMQQRILQLTNQIDGYKEVNVYNQKQIELISKELDGLKALYSRGHASITRILALEREESRIKGQFGSNKANIARAYNAIAETKVQILSIQKEFRESVLNELREANASVTELREQHHVILQKIKRIKLKAPVSGIVHESSIHTIGGVISAAEPVLKIIPVQSSLVVEARVNPVDVDQLYIGQEAKIQFSAFNRRTTPAIWGSVKTVAADRSLDQFSGLYYYLVKIEIFPDQRKLLGNLVLVPGMPADVFIQTEIRTPLSYLLKPLSDQLSKTFRN